MSESGDDQGVYTLEEDYVRKMLRRTNLQLEIIADLLSIETREDPLHARVVTLLCDSFSANYHLWRTLQTNLDINLIKGKEAKANYILLPPKDLSMLEQAIIARTFTGIELAKLNYSLKIH